MLALSGTNIPLSWCCCQDESLFHSNSLVRDRDRIKNDILQEQIRILQNWMFESYEKAQSSFCFLRLSYREKAGLQALIPIRNLEYDVDNRF